MQGAKLKIGILLIFMNSILLRASGGGYTDCKNMNRMHNTKCAGIRHIPHIPLS
jgi:hypothetical protein